MQINPEDCNKTLSKKKENQPPREAKAHLQEEQLSQVTLLPLGGANTGYYLTFF